MRAVHAVNAADALLGNPDHGGHIEEKHSRGPLQVYAFGKRVAAQGRHLDVFGVEGEVFLEDFFWGVARAAGHDHAFAAVDPAP